MDRGINMKVKKRWSFLVTSFVLMGVLLLMSRPTLDACSRQSVNGPTTQACVTSPLTVSWTRWLSGKSSSFQFHFLDLLELLYGGRGSAQ
jgi:hypothetical protein